MKIGTRSVLFGVHQFMIHPWFVALAWYELFGFPWDPRLWISFFVHDLGYWGKPNMDGPEGEKHVELGAWIMSLFGEEWRDFCLYHSRFYAKQHNRPFSRLCVADKLSLALTPRWLYLPMANWSGEVHEYMALAKARTAAGEPKYSSMNISSTDQERWYNDVREYLIRWVNEHRDGRDDTWTPRIIDQQWSLDDIPEERA